MQIRLCATWSSPSIAALTISGNVEYLSAFHIVFGNFFKS